MTKLDWILQKIAEHHPEHTDRSIGPMRVKALADSLASLRSGGSNLFGGSFALAMEEQARVDRLLVECLVEWRRELVDQPLMLQELDSFGRRLDIAGLTLKERLPLRCDPLGTRDGLSEAWQARLARLDEVVAGTRRIDAAAIEWTGSHDDEGSEAPPVGFGEPDEASLHQLALRYETETGRTFPRELAALLSTANGLFIDDDGTIASAANWSSMDPEDDDAPTRMCIGCGGYLQGSLCIEDERALLDAEVVDRDDDGEERARYANVAAFLDTLVPS